MTDCGTMYAVCGTTEPAIGLPFNNVYSSWGVSVSADPTCSADSCWCCLSRCCCRAMSSGIFPTVGNELESVVGGTLGAATVSGSGAKYDG